MEHLLSEIKKNNNPVLFAILKMNKVTYFSNLPKVLISMVSPLLQVKATPILREKK